MFTRRARAALLTTPEGDARRDASVRRCEMPRLLTRGDEAALEAFLLPRAESSMFLRSNARRAGLVDRGAPYQGTYAAAFEGDQITGVVAHGWNGNLLLQAPRDLPALVDLAVARSGRAVRGLIGPWSQVQGARAHLGLEGVTASMDSREDLFALALGELVLPPALERLRCRRATPEDVEVLAGWMRGYFVETIGAPDDDDTAAEARGSVERHVREGSQWILLDGARPVACSTFNARLPDTVQIGGVWTPHALRGRGYGRSVVAGSLLAALDEGVTRSILFTEPANAPARRAYQALGYRIIGDYGLVLFR